MRFELSGIEIEGLEERVKDSMSSRFYTESELTDIRTPLKYEMSVYNSVSDYADFVNEVSALRNVCILVPNAAIPENPQGYKNRLKKYLAKIFRWYVVPMADHQTNVNVSLYQLLCKMASHLQEQQIQILQLHKELCVLKGDYE